MSPRAQTRQRGIAAVELSLLLIPLIAIVIGIVELGRAMYYYETLVKSARDAARVLSTQAPSDPDYAALLDGARCTAVYGNSGCDGAPLLPGLSPDMVSVCDPASCSGTHAGVATGTGVINLVTVTIGGGAHPYTFPLASPLSAALFGLGMDFAAVGVTMRQVL